MNVGFLDCFARLAELTGCSLTVKPRLCAGLLDVSEAEGAVVANSPVAGLDYLRRVLSYLSHFAHASSSSWWQHDPLTLVVCARFAMHLSLGLLAGCVCFPEFPLLGRLDLAWSATLFSHEMRYHASNSLKLLCVHVEPVSQHFLLRC